MNESRRFLIQGVYFQQESGLSMGVGRVLWTSGMVGTEFSGSFASIPERFHCAFEGTMKDKVGESYLTDVEIEPDKLIFSKKYDHRQDVIRYSFVRRGSIFVGSYVGIASVGTGAAKCVLTEVPYDFFEQ